MIRLTESEQVSTTNRRDTSRRKGTDRRRAHPTDQFKGVERRVSDRRTKVERRGKIDPTTCERDYTLDEVEFMRAMDEYKRKNGRMFPTWSEVLEVVRSLGYVKNGVPPQTSATLPYNS